MKKSTKILLGIIIILTIGLITVLVLRFSTAEDTWLCQKGQWFKHGNPASPAPTTGCAIAVTTTSTPTTTNNDGSSEGIIIFSPKTNEEVTSPLTITGQVTGKDNWIGFEGQVGTVKLWDESEGVLASGVLQATSDWMKLPITFQTILNFDTSKLIGFKDGENRMVSLVFYNENPSGGPERDEIFNSLPIKILGSASNQINISVFFPNNQLDPNMMNCSKVFTTERTITKTPTVARAALEELFNGPTAEETKDGYFTTIPIGVKIQKLTIENGIAVIDLSKELDQRVGGSCRVAAIYAQITETLKQFSTVQKVIISIDGRTEDILQP